jgi:hypothetical protein
MIFHRGTRLPVERRGLRRDGPGARVACHRRDRPGHGHIDLADIDGRGRADYVKTFPDGSVQTAINMFAVNPETPHWEDHGIVASGVGEPDQTVRFADLNGDGCLWCCATAAGRT